MLFLTSLNSLAYPHDQAVSVIVDERGTHFDPDIADALPDVAGEFIAISMNYRDTFAES